MLFRFNLTAISYGVQPYSRAHSSFSSIYLSDSNLLLILGSAKSFQPLRSQANNIKTHVITMRLNWDISVLFRYWYINCCCSPSVTIDQPANIFGATEFNAQRPGLVRWHLIVPIRTIRRLWSYLCTILVVYEELKGFLKKRVKEITRLGVKKGKKNHMG